MTNDKVVGLRKIGKVGRIAPILFYYYFFKFLLLFLFITILLLSLILMVLGTTGR